MHSALFKETKNKGKKIEGEVLKTPNIVRIIHFYLFNVILFNCFYNVIDLFLCRRERSIQIQIQAEKN